jgi:hypothetical protein
MFRHDLEAIDALRRDAVNVREAHPSGIKKLQAYAAQLVWMSGKFPIDVRELLLRLLFIFPLAEDGRADFLGRNARSAPISPGTPPSATTRSIR